MSNKNKKKYARFQYSEDQLALAIKDVRNGTSNIHTACAKYNIPKTTLWNKIKGNVPEERKMGPKPVLLPEEEDELENWIIAKAKLGFPMQPDDVLNAVQTILNKSKRESPFKDNRPGQKWLKLFLNRKKNISKRNAEVVSKARAAVSETNLRDWFSDLSTYLKENDCLDILENGSRILNCDETGIQMCPKLGTVLTEKNCKDVYSVASGGEKETTTVLFTFSGDGKSQPPMIVLPYKRIPNFIFNSIPKDWAVGRSDSGWMQSSTFYEYVANILYPWLVKENVPFPVLLLLDGHKSHINIELSNFCSEKQIILYSLYPNSTHILQPCDVGIFKSLKVNWKNAVKKHQQETTTPVTKGNFAPLLKIAFDKTNKVETIQNAFRKCGLYPFDPEAVDYSKCMSRRREEVFRNLDDDDITRDHYVISKQTIENYIGEAQLQNFEDMKSTNLSSNDSLYNFWCFCSDKTQSVNPPNNHDLITQPEHNDSVIFEFPEWSPENNENANNVIILQADLSGGLNVETPEIEFEDEATINDLADNTNVPQSSSDEPVTDTEPVIDSNTEHSEIPSSGEILDQQSSSKDQNINSITTNPHIESGQNHNNIVVAAQEPKEINKSIDEVYSPALNVLCPSATRTPFDKNLWKQHLHWPKIEDKKKEKKNCTQKMPYAVTSEEWKNMQLQKDEIKTQKEKEIMEKRTQRIEKKKMKEKEMEEKKRVREMKRKIKQEETEKNKAMGRKRKQENVNKDCQKRKRMPKSSD